MSRLRIGPRVVAAFLVVALLVVVGSLVPYTGFRFAMRQRGRALVGYARFIVSGLKLENAVLQRELALNQGNEAAASRLWPRIYADEEDMQHAWEIMVKADPDLIDRRLAGRFAAALARLKAEQPQPGKRTVHSRRNTQELVDALESMTYRATRRTEEQWALALEAEHTARIVSAAVVAVLSMMATALALMVTLSLTRPLKQLHAQIRAIDRDGRLPSSPAVTGSDEVADLALAFHNLVNKAAAVAQSESRGKWLLAASLRITRAQEAERGRLARDLHDGLSQLLAALKMELGVAAHALGKGDHPAAATHLTRARSMVDESLEELRRISFDLRPPALDHLPLDAALAAYARGVNGLPGLSVVADAETFDPRLPLDVEVALYRICQEALGNIAKHAQATRATVSLKQDAEHVVLTVSDDGVGFEPTACRAAESACGVGLASMRRRAEELGGAFEVDSAPGKGTTIRVTLPREVTE